ncbi:MAG: cytochrome P450 [Thermomicrobiales bacterium]|nr:cytochrome P450 [Thermomicrobiales bacterium]
MLAERAASYDHLLAGPAFFADPYPVYGRLREEQPVYWSDAWQCWLVTRYGTILDALRNHRTYSNKGRQTSFISRLPEERRENLRNLSSHYDKGGMSNQDPPDHTRLRGLVNLAFTPRVIAEMEPRIQEIVESLAGGLDVDTPVDFISRFANPLPATVIAELLGLPQEDRPIFQRWSNTITAFLGTGAADAASAQLGQDAMAALRAYLGAKIAERKHQPTDDLLGRFASADAEGDRLTENEMIGSCVTLLLGGHETTTNLLGNGLLALLRNPEQLERLRAEPELIPGAIDELLRFDSPVQRIWRIVAEDTVIEDQTLRTGDAVFLMTGAANRDDQQFSEPGQLDVTRNPNRHLTFGHGIHFCLGSVLARLEARIAFTTLFQRFPRIELHPGPVAYHPNVAFRGLTSLPIVVSTGSE